MLVWLRPILVFSLSLSQAEQFYFNKVWSLVVELDRKQCNRNERILNLTSFGDQSENKILNKQWILCKSTLIENLGLDQKQAGAEVGQTQLKLELELSFTLFTICCIREGFKKKNGLFNDIDQIAFNTHPPPPKDDIWKND